MVLMGTAMHRSTDTSSASSASAVSEGDAFSAGDSLAEIETDKALKLSYRLVRPRSTVVNRYWLR